eukprot:CAMPEP_0202914152 /NCGR_PEP_ID=MMETSP1392-20130828/62383_1 /ASSEMBLY_ACC=CAM_ASM_000868 /TAXON_ID=225041 /ORGANISM="Chlamydomonas chlamydogama, Strain SAG 11-48b" /LENGTH=54 /DNA_ID=CAMNT_0049605687 /DNA_START=166 /DNA_END=327 /DNA_ORIENTATION=+
MNHADMGPSRLPSLLNNAVHQSKAIVSCLLTHTKQATYEIQQHCTSTTFTSKPA